MISDKDKEIIIKYAKKSLFSKLVEKRGLRIYG